MDKYGIQEQIKLLQNAKTAREISERADYFTLIIKENEALKREYNRQYELCYKEAELSPDCKPYYCVKKLKAENKALKERLYKSFELRLELNQNFWRVCGETGRVVEFMVVQINLYPDEIRYIDDSYNDFSVDEIGETVFLTKAEAEARLKEIKGEKE